MKTIFVLMMLIITSSVFAGERGNGGDLVVCRNPDGTIISAELLDYYEGRVMRRLPVKEYPELSDEEFIDMMAKKINEMEDYYNPFWITGAKDLLRNIHLYLQTGQSDSEEILFTEEDLTDIPDSGELVIKKGCNIEQVAIWLKKTYPEDPIFILKANLLAHLSQRDLRGLVLHEILYMLLSQRNAERKCDMNDSVPVRYYHQKLLSRPITEFSFIDHLKFVQSTCHGYAFLKKNHLEVRVAPEIPGEVLPEDGAMFVWVYELWANPILPKHVKLVMDKNGKLNRKLSEELGQFLVKAYGPGSYNGIHPGSVEFFFKNDQMWVGDSFLYQSGLWMNFGKSKMRVRLDKSEGQIIPATKWGFQYSMGYMLINMNATSEAQLSSEHELNFKLTENFDVTLN